MTKEDISPSIFVGCSLLPPPSPLAHDTFSVSPQQDVSGWMSISQCGYLVGKIIHSLVGLGDKNLCDSITSVLYSVSPDPWSPSLSCHLPCCQMHVQVQLSLIVPPLLGVQFYSPCFGSEFPCRTICPSAMGLSPLVIYAKLTLLSLCLDLVTSSTCSLPAPHLWWLICPVSPPSSAYSAHSYLFLQDPELQCPRPLRESILWHLQFAQVAPSPWLSLEILVPSPGQPGEHIHLALCLLIKQAAHTSYLGMPLQDCFPDLAYRHWPGFASSPILQGHSQKLLGERKVCVQVKMPALNALLSIWPH